jgi:hypothetical protein
MEDYSSVPFGLSAGRAGLASPSDKRMYFLHEPALGCKFDPHADLLGTREAMGFGDIAFQVRTMDRHLANDLIPTTTAACAAIARWPTSSASPS